MRSNGRAFKSQGGSVERLWRVVGFERLFCPTGETRHSLEILKTPVPAGFVFAHPAPFFFLAQETRVTEDRTLCFCRKGMHGIQEKGVCVLCHGVEFISAEDDVEMLF